MMYDREKLREFFIGMAVFLVINVVALGSLGALAAGAIAFFTVSCR